jgi:hypothetical protein
MTTYRCTLDGVRHPMAIAHLLPGDVLVAECPQGTMTMESDPSGDFGWVTVYCDDPCPRTGRYFNALRLAQNTPLRMRRVITLATRALRDGGAAVIEYGELQTYPERTEPGPIAFRLVEIHETKEA